MTFESQLNLTPSIYLSFLTPNLSPKSLHASMLSLPQFHGHCDSFHYWAFIHATTSFWIFFHPSHLNSDSLPQRSLFRFPSVGHCSVIYSHGQVVVSLGGFALVYNYTFIRALSDKYLSPYPPPCSH